MNEKRERQEEKWKWYRRALKKNCGKSGAHRKKTIETKQWNRRLEMWTKRIVLKKQVWKVRADRLVTCNMMSGRKKMQRKPLSELYLGGKITEDRDEWQKELQGHCEEVHTHHEETREEQEKIIEYFWKETDTSRMTGEEQRLRLTWCYKPRSMIKQLRVRDWSIVVSCHYSLSV